MPRQRPIRRDALPAPSGKGACPACGKAFAEGEERVVRPHVDFHPRCWSQVRPRANEPGTTGLLAAGRMPARSVSGYRGVTRCGGLVKPWRAETPKSWGQGRRSLGNFATAEEAARAYDAAARERWGPGSPMLNFPEEMTA